MIAVAVRQSPDLARARLDLATAQGQLQQAQGITDTHIGAQAQSNVSHGGVRDPSGEFDVEHVEASLSKALSTGGTLSVTVSGDRQLSQLSGLDANGNLTPEPAGTRYAAGAQVALTQPLLRGAGSSAFEATIHQAERQRDAAALLQEARARDLLVALAQSYWQVAFAWRQLEVRKASLDLAQKQLAFTEGAIRAEKVAQSEALAVQQVIAVRRQDVIAGEQELYDRSIALRQLAGLEIGPDALDLKTDELPRKIDPSQLDLAAVVRAAFDHSAELAALAASHRAAEIGMAAADNAAKSRLDLALSAGPLGADRKAGDAVHNLFAHTGFLFIGSLVFDHAIEQSAERGGQAVARAALHQAEVAERDARAKLALRATRAVQRAEAALASITLGDEAIGLAEQNITAEQKRFELGKSTNFEVLRRQDELEQARLRQASSVNDYLAARADLDGLSGAILARYGVVMP
ncbi:MAG TPA: TolC family protein [Kofleriaceae bacterium]|nr:TolC family protein [Kofleriaceae bacterium]